ncbi:MAG: nucleoside-diphosphate kinase, partial [Parcubacteria group bacterium CG_4_10_14_0_2_um_filter_41_6]
MKDPKEEQTYVMIKPDGVRKGLIGEIIKRFEQRDLKIVALEMFQPSYDQIDNHYPKDEEWITRLGNKTLTTYEKYGYD